MMSSQTWISDFVHDTDYQSLPTEVRHQIRRCILDLVGVAAAGTGTPLSRIMRDHAHRHGAGAPDASRLLFDGRRVSATHAALANAATIDSMDGHDGHRLVKGHAGAALLPAALAFLDRPGESHTYDLIAALAVGYEIALRAGLVLHDTAADYHSSGAWNALGAAAVGARLLELDTATTWQALGIAEYSAPRAPMMRAIAHPTMVKDSSAWGAQAGVAAALLAHDGFTGAPAELLTTGDHWADLGTSWHCLEQYFKPYPVCRWAHPAVQAALELVAEHAVIPHQITGVRVTTFEEATRLSRHDPQTTEEAQYSLPFAVAAALADGELVPENVLHPDTNPDTHRLLNLVELTRSAEMSAEFPAVRRATVRIELRNGRTLSSDSTTAKGDPEEPLTDNELLTKFRNNTKTLNPATVASLEDSLLDDSSRQLADMMQLLTTPTEIASAQQT